MKFGLSKYSKPTPKNIRKFADSTLAACAFMSIYPIITNNHSAAIIIVLVGGGAKFVSDFFAEDVSTK